MIQRNALETGSLLSFPGMEIEILSVLGQGSNAIVYKGSYEDGLTENARHTVLVKELFPFHPKGLISRNSEGRIVVDPAANDFFLLNRLSFERGNKAHLKLLELYPDKIGGNVNTFEFNGTFYTVLAESGGRDIYASEKPKTLKILTRRMLSMLDALSAFHESDLLHLDISPDNILFIGKGESERCMLIDFNSVFSPEEILYGKDAYFSVKQGFSAPEVVSRNMNAVSLSADLYSVAAVFFFMLMGRPLSLKETLQKNPPDVSDAGLLKDAPETVVSQIRAILKKGLASLPARRYASIQDMREAFEELMRRIDMLGVTHAALWEAGKRNIQKLTHENPFYGYLGNENEMFPVRIRMENGDTQAMGEFLNEFLSENGESMCVVSGGGMGKTTLLLKSALMLSNGYAPQKPAQMYVSLAGRKNGEKDFILDEILKSLRFTSDTATYDGARHALQTVLSSPLKTKNGDVPTLVLLLDGLNEATGDTALLYQEISKLDKLPGLRMLVASRAEEEEIPFARISLSALSDKDVEDALIKRGLLMPENAEIQALLKTPLMLSLFLKASVDSQLTLETEEELMNAYVSALLQKEKEALGDDEGQKYRIDAAVRYVLCALALKAGKSGGAISETEAFDAVKKCRKTLLSKNLSRAFPLWIGHRKDIVLSSDDEFYGEMVHEILVRRMGLVVRVNGLIRISHARIGEYLAGKHAGNERKIRKRRMLSYAALLAALLVLLAGGYFAYDTWLKDYEIKVEIPKVPYDDAMAERCLSYAVNGYTEFGALYDEMAELLGGELAQPQILSIEEARKGYQDYLSDFKEGIQNELSEIDGTTDRSVIDIDVSASADTPNASMAESKTDSSDDEEYELEYLNVLQMNRASLRQKKYTNELYIRYIDEMMKSGGEVVRWSQKPFDGDTAKELILFSGECQEVYSRAAELHFQWKVHERLIGFCPDYEKKFIDLVKADAVVALQMYQVACAPHRSGSNGIWMEQRMELLASVTGTKYYLESERSGATGEAALQDLANARDGRQKALTALEAEMYELEMYLSTEGN